MDPVSDVTSRFVFGIPTVRRPRDYLRDTVRALVNELPLDTARAQVVVLNAEPTPSAHVAVAQIEHEYRELVASRFLNVLAPAAQVSPIDEPSLSAVPYERWRKKLVYDCARLFDACRQRGEFYVHLEDDVVLAERFWPELEDWFETHFARREDWSALCIYSQIELVDRQAYPLERFGGLIGLLVRCQDLGPAARYLLQHADRAPADWLMRDFLAASGRGVYVRVPSLIQHVGVISSLAGKVQPIESPTFEEPLRRLASRRAGAVRDVWRHVRPGLWRYLRARLSVRRRVWLFGRRSQ